MHIDNAQESNKIALFQNTVHSLSIPQEIRTAYQKEMLLRLSWNTNHLEGNTLSLEETIDVIEYDEVRSGHTFHEYKEAKSAYTAYEKLLDFEKRIVINVDYIQKINSIIMDSDGSFRNNQVYIGTLAESAYLPPEPDKIPELMQAYTNNPALRMPESDTPETPDIPGIISAAAKLHMDFEKIHPFRDGNGRTGRLFLNQFLLNNNLQPAIIETTSRYRQAFRYYEQSDDPSLMEHCIASGIIRSYEVLKANYEKLKK